jgi:hypothetical protein
MFDVTIVGGGKFAHQRTETGTKPSDKNESCKDRFSKEWRRLEQYREKHVPFIIAVERN